MRCPFLAYLFIISCASAQTNQIPVPPPAQPPQTSDVITITPDTVIATVNGRQFTAGDLEKITRNLNPQSRQLAASQPKAFLEQYAFGESLAAEAVKLKIDQVPPYRDRLAGARRQILTQGLLEQKKSEFKITPEEMKKYYEANQAGFRQASVKVLFISRVSLVRNLGDGSTKSVTPEEIKAKVEKVAKLAKDGGDFAALAKEYSDDRNTADHGADLPYPIRANSAEIPENVREALMAGAAGDIIGPLEHTSGFYLFKIKSQSQAPLESVRADIERSIQETKLREWIDQQKAKTTVTLDHEPFWKTFVAASKEMLDQEQRAKKAEQQTIDGVAR